MVWIGHSHISAGLQRAVRGQIALTHLREERVEVGIQNLAGPPTPLLRAFLHLHAVVTRARPCSVPAVMMHIALNPR